MKSFKLINNITGWGVFVIAAVVYLMTIEPTASFWDCGEFISTAYKLEVGHPPGAPFFMMTGRLFTMLASDPSHVAMMMNSFSALCSAFCILFLFWTITHLARKLVVGNGYEMTNGQLIAVMGSGVIGALAYTFSDTFWFSAVEGEVYAYSSLFTAVVFWCMLKWEECADEPYSNRWIIFIAYLMGLSVAVHLLNLLSIPALVLIYYFKKYKTTTKGIILALLFSVVLLAALLYGLVPGFVMVASWFELFFVNKLGYSFNSGVVFYSVILLLSLIYTTYETGKIRENNDNKRAKILFIITIVLLGIPFFGGKVIAIGLLITAAIAFVTFRTSLKLLNTIMLCITVIMIGYASYAVVVIRSSANPPMDQNSPDDIFSLQGYLNRDQYGDTPLLYGESYASKIKHKKDERGRWVYDYSVVSDLWGKDPRTEKDMYEKYGEKKKYHYVDELLMLFPRMHSSQENHVKAYKEWANIKGKQVRYMERGEQKTVTAPTFGENLTFFFRYQVGFMYWRYFMWNFVGRQNDIQGHGGIMNGNWISGIDFIDEARLGNQSALPDELKNNKGRNVYYFLPLLLGILGILYQFSKKQKGMESFWITLTLFFMTGLAIVLYLNQTPYQPRERDYAYAGSFYAYCIWIGLGVLYIAQLLGKFLDKRIAASLATLIAIPVPALMAQQNWDDHDRSNRYTARDYGQNYLNSLAPNAIIFTHGDNDTFPLWYNQEVEGVRTDVRVANMSYLQMDWYVDQMFKWAYKSAPVPNKYLNKSSYSNGRCDVAYIAPARGLNAISIDNAVKCAASERAYNAKFGYSDEYDMIPCELLIMENDTNTVMENMKGMIAPALDTSDFASRMRIDLSEKGTNRTWIGKHEIFVLNLIASNKNWKRPIYFAISGGEDLGLDRYFQLEGMANRLVPFEANGIVNTDAMYNNVMNKFKWGGLDKEGVDIYMDENNIRMATTMRHVFMSLADQLIAENKYSKAEKVLDKCVKVLPHKFVPYNFRMLQVAEQYILINKKEKGEAILDILAKNSSQYMKWFSTLNNNQVKSIQQEFNVHSYTINNAAKLYEKLGKADKSKKLIEDTEEIAKRVYSNLTK